MGDACPWPPTAMFCAGLLQRGGTCGQASPVGVLTTQDRPCPVHQSSEASHPAPAAVPQAHRAQAGLIWLHSGVGWRAAAQVGLMPRYPPPPRLPCQGLAGSREGGGCPGVAEMAVPRVLRTLGSCPARLPTPGASSSASNFSFICLDSAIPEPACPLAAWLGRLGTPLA